MLKYNLKTGKFVGLDLGAKFMQHEILLQFWGLRPNQGLTIAEIIERCYPLNHRPSDNNIVRLITELNYHLEPIKCRLVRITKHEGYKLCQLA